MTLAVLTGCAPTPVLDEALDQYNTRLARSLQQPAPDNLVAGGARLPAAKALQTQRPTQSINLLEFLQLYSCELHHVIAERNSSLGRMGGGSEQLLFDVQFLRYVDACIAQILPTDAEIAQQLTAAKQVKLDNLPAAIWQATVGGQEFRQFWQRDSVQHDYPLSADSGTSLAMDYLVATIARLLAGDYEIDEQQFYKALSAIRNQEGGELIYAWQKVGLGMQVADQTITSRLAQRPLCFKNLATPKSDIFRNVVLSYFVQGVQPLVAVMDRQYFAVIQPVRQMEAMLADAEPQAYSRYRQQRDLELERHRDSVAQHVQSLSGLMVSCGYLPGSKV